MVWPQNEDENPRLTLDLDKILSDVNMEELEALTGCRLVRVLNEHRIYIGSHSETESALALSKLEILHKYQVSDTAFMSTAKLNLF